LHSIDFRNIVDDRNLKLLSGSCYLPHPDKEETGGEDAHFICKDEQVIGIADGVGGWADVGVNAGEFSRELMSHSVSAIQEEPNGSFDPARVLEKAHAKTKAQGSSTACIITLNSEVCSSLTGEITPSCFLNIIIDGLWPELRIEYF
jgi:protein phosphatase PTC7